MLEDLAAFIHRLRGRSAGGISSLVAKNRGGAHPYLLTTALMGLALFVRLALAPINVGLQYVTFFPVVAIAAIVGGYRAGLFATIIGVGLATYIFTPPYFSFSIDVAQANIWADMVFLMGGIIVSFSIEAMHRFRQQYQQKLKETQESEARVIKLNEELEKQIAERRQAEAELARHMRDLGERIKEIEGLRDITNLLLAKELSVEQTLDACVRRLPAAWLDPLHTCARIRIDGQTYETANFREAEWKLEAAISVPRMGQGLVEVFYFGEGSGDGKSPFLDEEHTLIQSVAIQISQLLEKRLAEAALQQNQAELKEAQRIAHVGSWRLDVATNHVVWSEELYRMFALDPGSPPPDYPDQRKLFTPEGWKRLSTALPRTQETGIPYEVELEMIRADGSHGWMLARGEAIRDASGAIATLQGVAMDITERKRAEDELRDSEGRYRALVENSPMCIHEIGMDGRLTSMNRAGLLMMGVEDESAVCDRLYLDAVSDADRERIGELLGKAYAGEASYFEFRSAGSPGRIFKSCFVPVTNNEGTVIKLMGITEDITDRKQAELEMEISEIRYKTLFEQTADYVLVLEPQEAAPPIIVDANEAAFTKHGYSRSELIGKPITFLDSEASGKSLPERVRLLQSGKPAHFEVEHVCKDGSRFWADAAVRQVTIGGKSLFYSVERDATDRKKAEHALAESVRKLEEKELAKTRFFAAAGHDLRQPLAAAVLYIDALKLGELTSRQNEIVQRLDRSMATFNGLLDTLLNISKLDSGVVKAEYAPVNVAEVFNWLEQNFAPAAREKQIGFKLHFPMREKLFVTSDIGLFNSVLMNLVSNAIKFTPKGGILVGARRRGSEVLFQVWDTGLGIAGENIGHIFDEFYQINNPQRDRTSGLGLGLAIAKRAITLLDSKITCRSQIGRGSVFEFRLPLHGTAGGVMQRNIIVASQEEEAVNDSFAQGMRFVVVEDDVLVAQAIINLLEGMGGEVQRFHSAEDALLSAHTEYADYYIVDYMLSGTVSGIQFLNQLHQKLGKPIKAVLMTGDTSKTLIRDTADFDWPVLYKPVNMFKLISSLKAQAE